MTVFNEGRHAAEFLVSEANGHRSRETVTIASGEDLAAGAVLGQVSADSTYKLYDPGNADGSETAVAVLYDAVDASGGEEPGVIVARDAEVDAAALTWFGGADAGQIETGTSELADEGIVAR